MRALIVIAGLLAVAGIAAAATPPPPTTLVHTPAPVKALAQDAGQLGWLAGDGKKCNTIHLLANGHTYVLPQPATGSMTCHWALSSLVHLAIASDAHAALWTLHENGSDFVMTAQIAGKEVEVERLAHAGGTGWWLGGITGGGPTMAYSSVDVEYVDPLACGSGGSCKKKIAGGGIDLVSAGQKTALHNAGPALGLAVSSGRIAYIPATTVAKGGFPASSPTTLIPVRDASSGALVSRAKPVGDPLAVGLSAHVLAVLTRNAAGTQRLTWYDPATGHKLGGIGVPVNTTAIAVNDQFVVYRFGRGLRAVVLATHHVRPLGKTAAVYVGLSLDQGRLVWAENHTTYGLIRALSIH